MKHLHLSISKTAQELIVWVVGEIVGFFFFPLSFVLNKSSTSVQVVLDCIQAWPTKTILHSKLDLLIELEFLNLTLADETAQRNN